MKGSFGGAQEQLAATSAAEKGPATSERASPPLTAGIQDTHVSLLTRKQKAEYKWTGKSIIYRLYHRTDNQLEKRIFEPSKKKKKNTYILYILLRQLEINASQTC